jgi:2-polyprenyl-6-methoxyphenol hydroxylase-like FAD-dependent oxidoreductase
MAGLFAGNLLLRAGWDVQVFERATSKLDARGAGIGTHDELFAAMREAGAKVDELIGIQVEGRAAYDSTGSEIARFSYPQYLTSWGLLYRRLHAALPADRYKLDQSVLDVVEDDDKVTLVMANGTRHAADLVVGADGSWSTVRERCNPDEMPQYCGYVAWRGLLDENAMPQAFRERYARFLNFFMSEDQQLICYPVAGADDSVAVGGRRFSFLWYRPYDADTELPGLLTDEDGIRHRYQIAPTRIAARHIERLHDEAPSMLPPDFAQLIRAIERPFLQPIYDMIPSRIAFRRVALIGDAACVARPHVGAGVAKAATDATALVAALGAVQRVRDALQRFQEQRQPFGKALVERGRYLGAYLEWPHTDRRHVPTLPTEEIIRESAMLMHNH